jgi:hypothetical protein
VAQPVLAIVDTHSMSPCPVELQRLNTELASPARVIAEAEAPIAKLQAAQAALAAAESRHRAAVDADMRSLARWLIDTMSGTMIIRTPTETEVAWHHHARHRLVRVPEHAARHFCWNAGFRRAPDELQGAAPS